MSSSTSVLGMTKLTDSENFSNSVLNGNWNILDAFAGKMNGKNTATDLDDVKPTNTHQVVAYNYGNTASNRPCSSGGIVIANGSATYFTQIAYPNYTAGAMPFVRSYGANGFTPWIGLVGSETLANNTNLNDVKTPGCWLLSGSNTYTNKPSSTNLLMVYRPNPSGTTVLQVAYGITKAYSRFATSATAWSDWLTLDRRGDGWLPTGTDINSIAKAGSYGISGSNTYTNLPTGASYGVLEVIAPGDTENYVIQRLMTGDKIFTRYRGSSSGTSWGSWYKFTGTAV